MPLDNSPDLSVLTAIPDRDLEDIIAAIHAGATEPAQALGFSPAALNSFERMGQAYYRTHQFGKAATIFGFVLQLDMQRGSAWRSLGACAHAQQNYTHAIVCYTQAVALDGGDIPSRVFLGEALCLGGERDKGLEILNAALDLDTEKAAYRPYLTRARAIVAHDGGMPTTLVLRRHGETLFQEVDEALEQEDSVALETLDPDRDIEWSDIEANPKLLKAIRELSEHVKEGRLTYAQVGGFTDRELSGAYAVACKYAETGELLRAIQIAGYLIFLDPHRAPYYQLVGICLHRMKQYEGADFYYRMAQILEPKDPMTLVYRGEAMIMAGKVDAGLELVREGRECAKGAAEHSKIVDRADVLVRQFGTATGHP